MSERESGPACARGSVIFFSAMWRHIVSAQGVMRQIMKGIVSIDSAVQGAQPHCVIQAKRARARCWAEGRFEHLRGTGTIGTVGG